MNDADLVARVRGGDQLAYRPLVERHGRRLHRLAYRIVGNRQDAEDVVQETFLRAYRQIDRFEPRVPFGNWLNRIAANAAVDLVRARRRRHRSLVPEGSEGILLESAASDDPAPDRVAWGGEVLQRVAQAMEDLSPQERATFVLRHFEERSIRETAAALGQTENTTKQALFRAVRKLRRALAPEGVSAGTTSP